MSWVSLEEAEPIPDIHWGIRVLHPPPDQQNVQYGELGEWQTSAFSGSPARDTAEAPPSSGRRLSRISSKAFLILWSWGVASRDLSTCCGYQHQVLPGRIICSEKIEV